MMVEEDINCNSSCTLTTAVDLHPPPVHQPTLSHHCACLSSSPLLLPLLHAPTSLVTALKTRSLSNNVHCSDMPFRIQSKWACVLVYIKPAKGFTILFRKYYDLCTTIASRTCPQPAPRTMKAGSTMMNYLYPSVNVSSISMGALQQSLAGFSCLSSLQLCRGYFYLTNLLYITSLFVVFKVFVKAKIKITLYL